MSIEDSVTVSAAEFRRKVGLYQHIALTKPVTITKNGCEQTVLLSAQEYARLKRRDRRVIAAGELSAGSALMLSKGSTATVRDGSPMVTAGAKGARSATSVWCRPAQRTPMAATASNPIATADNAAQRLNCDHDFSDSVCGASMGSTRPGTSTECVITSGNGVGRVGRSAASLGRDTGAISR